MGKREEERGGTDAFSMCIGKSVRTVGTLAVIVFVSSRGYSTSPPPVSLPLTL